jgi:hypothetical protein
MKTTNSDTLGGIDSARMDHLVSGLEGVLRDASEQSDGALVPWYEWSIEQVAEVRANLRRAVRSIIALP